eukprot:superscaffoldBa00005029_g19804
MVWSCVSDFFTYETTKSVVVKSWSVGIINRIVQLLIIAYFVSWVFIHEKAYQVTDTSIESSVMTKVKGFGYYHNRVMDVADYVFPQQTTFPSLKASTLFSVNTLLSKAMLNVENFTIFIKNSIRFPLFNVTRGNFPSTMTTSEIKNCIYHPETKPFCPIFRVGDVLNYTGQNMESLKMVSSFLLFLLNNSFTLHPQLLTSQWTTQKVTLISNLEFQGGEIGINIQWKCNLDLSIEYCVPRYSFTRLDAPFAKNAVSKGYNFRFAKYFKMENGTEFRTLHKAFAIRFDVMVTGNAGKFDTIPTLINLVAAFTSVGLGTVLCDVILLNFLKGAEQYKAKKFEEVSDAQIEASLAQSPGSSLSLKPGIKSSYDSGAISLTTSDQPV